MTENKRFVDDEIESVVDQSFTDTLTDKTYWIDNGLEDIVDLLNNLYDENEELKKENQNYKHYLQDLGLLMTDEKVMDIRIEIVDKVLKPLCKENGFDVDIDCTNGFTIIPKGDV